MPSLEAVLFPEDSADEAFDSIAAAEAPYGRVLERVAMTTASASVRAVVTGLEGNLNKEPVPLLLNNSDE